MRLDGPKIRDISNKDHLASKNVTEKQVNDVNSNELKFGSTYSLANYNMKNP